MAKGLARTLDFTRKLLLRTATLLAVALPVVSGRLESRAASQAPNTAHSYEYEVTSIKPVKSGSFMVTL
jgi:hypothetical protein